MQSRWLGLKSAVQLNPFYSINKQLKKTWSTEYYIGCSKLETGHLVTFHIFLTAKCS